MPLPIGSFPTLPDEGVFCQACAVKELAAAARTQADRPVEVLISEWRTSVDLNSARLEASKPVPAQERAGGSDSQP